MKQQSLICGGEGSNASNISGGGGGTISLYTSMEEGVVEDGRIPGVGILPRLTVSTTSSFCASYDLDEW